MYRSIACTSLAVVSLALSVVPCSAQQPSSAAAPLGQPASVIRQEDCPKLISEINAATNVRFDPAAANARQVVANASKLQADGRYAECFAAAQPTRDLLVMSPVSVAVAPVINDWRLWAHPDEYSDWVRRPQRP